MPPPESMKPQLLFASIQCSIDEAGKGGSSQWITTQKQLDRLYVQLNKQVMGGKPVVPRLDFITSGVLLLNMGKKPTGGYQLKLPEQTLVIKDDTAVLQVEWIEPSRGAMLTQVLTSPCLLVRMPLAGYRHIRVVDQNNVTRAQLSL